MSTPPSARDNSKTTPTLDVVRDALAYHVIASVQTSTGYLYRGGLTGIDDAMTVSLAAADYVRIGRDGNPRGSPTPCGGDGSVTIAGSSVEFVTLPSSLAPTFRAVATDVVRRRAMAQRKSRVEEIKRRAAERVAKARGRGNAAAGGRGGKFGVPSRGGEEGRMRGGTASRGRGGGSGSRGRGRGRARGRR